MDVTKSSLCCFAVLTVFSLSAVLCESPEGLGIFDLDDYDEEDFLAGEDTPVWIAHLPGGATSVNYTKLDNGMVKKAVDYWKSDEFDGISSRPRRSADGYTDSIKDLWNSAIQKFVVSTPNDNEKSDERIEMKSRNKRSNEPHPKVLHPSVLIMMDYEITWPMDKVKQEKLIMERILYALAFWNGVDLQLRHLQNPKVRLRIVGIIIGRNKGATPYLRENEHSNLLTVDNTFGPMSKYWGQMSNINKDFSVNAYDIVATMTDATPRRFLSSTTQGVASSWPPCYPPLREIAVVLFCDDFAFGGIQVAVHETSHVLGGRHDGESPECPAETGNVLAPDTNSMGRKWSKCSLKEISKTLNDQGWCMKNPKIYHSPGYPVQAILPGKLMPASKQCQIRGWVDGNVCWESVTCDYLYCSNNHWSSKCRNSGAPIDGTTCNPGQMCLDGQCVSNSTQFAI